MRLFLEYLDYRDALRHSCHLLNYYLYEYDTIIEYYYEYVIIIYSTDFIVLTFGVGPSAHN